MGSATLYDITELCVLHDRRGDGRGHLPLNLHLTALADTAVGVADVGRFAEVDVTHRAVSVVGKLALLPDKQQRVLALMDVVLTCRRIRRDLVLCVPLKDLVGQGMVVIVC